MSDKPICRLLDEPVEIRNLIYEHLNVQHIEILNCQITSAYANVSLTCWQVYHEIREIIHSKGVITFYSESP